ncbi:MAG: FAD-dependent oxidoreductase [Candidatus Cloacimonetes bacterium]|nr:FAD-dependent oxidoreductase [Candidatus Cloacimonadota bacterium]
MQTYDVIIIGGGPSGIIAGVTGKKQNPDKSFLMIKEEAKGLVPCGIPYIFYALGDVTKNMMGPKPFIDAGGEVYVDQVVDIDLESRTVITCDHSRFGFKKLVFATGSTPVVPSFIPGYDLEGVEYIIKSYDYIEALKAKTDLAKNIVVIGGGFIGVEVAEQLAQHKDKKVSLVEMEALCLSRAFSPDVALRADAAIKETGIQLYTSNRVSEILGENDKVTGVKLQDGTVIEAELVIASIGYRPNTGLAKNLGLQINKNHAIVVDRYMRTAVPDVFAIGDCSQTTGFITGRTDNIMLASTATAEARVLGYNLFNIKLLRNFTGTLSVFSTKINGVSFASAGAIEQTAQEANISYIVGKFEDVDRHPATLPDTSKMMVKLVVSPQTSTIIGGEIIGGDSTGELINLIALAIQKYVTVYELLSFQVGTHPLLTTAPTKYVLIKAAENAVAQLHK